MGKLYEHFDLVIVGAGGAGVAAAVAAAGSGARVALLEREPSLGGLYVQAGMTAFTPVLPGAYLPGLWELAPVQGGVCRVDPQQLQQYEYRLLRERDVFLLPSAWVMQAELDNGVLRSVTAMTREGPLTVEGEVFLDASGDGDLASLSSVPCTIGREEDGRCLPPYFCVTLEGVERDFPEKIDCRLGCVRGLRLMAGPGSQVTARLLYDGQVSAISAVDRARSDLGLRAMVDPVAEYLRTLPGFSGAKVLRTGLRVIFPEGRHPLGRTVMDSRDLCDPTAYEDGILEGIRSPIELPGMEEVEELPQTAPYCLPLRALVAARVKNLLLAGRCVSATHRAFGSLSSFHMTLATGCAAGLAAVLALEEEDRVQRVDAARLRSRLEKMA